MTKLKIALICSYTQFSILSDHSRPFPVNNVPFPIIESVTQDNDNRYDAGICKITRMDDMSEWCGSPSCS